MVQFRIARPSRIPDLLLRISEQLQLVFKSRLFVGRVLEVPPLDVVVDGCPMRVSSDALEGAPRGDQVCEIHVESRLNVVLGVSAESNALDVALVLFRALRAVLHFRAAPDPPE